MEAAFQSGSAREPVPASAERRAAGLGREIESTRLREGVRQRIAQRRFSSPSPSSASTRRPQAVQRTQSFRGAFPSGSAWERVPAGTPRGAADLSHGARGLPACDRPQPAKREMRLWG